MKKPKALIGAVAGDIYGSPYEALPSWKLPERIDYNHPQQNFTDDTVLTIAVADALLNENDFGEKIYEYARNYPGRGYGGNFRQWIRAGGGKPYNSFGNGSAMRVSPVAWAGQNMEEVLALAEQSAAVTHNHPEGIKGAQAVAAAIFLARQGETKKAVKDFVEQTFGYDLNFSIAAIRPFYNGNVTCQASVPPSIRAFLDSNDFMSAIHNAIIIGGDTDTQAAIAGSIASAYYDDIPGEVYATAERLLPAAFLDVMERFEHTFGTK